METCNGNKKEELPFYLAYALLALYRVIKSSTIGFSDGGALYIIISILFAINVFQMKNSKLRLLAICAVGAIIALSIFKVMDPVLPVVFLALISSKNIKFRRIVKLSFIITIFAVTVIVLLSTLGIIEDTQSYRFFGNSKIICHGMGFNHSSALPTYFCFAFLSFFYLYPKNRKVVTIGLWLIVGFIIFLFCAERLRFFTLMIASLLIVFQRFNRNKHIKIRNFIMVCIFPICCAATILAGYNYAPSNALMSKVNVTMSNRLYLEKQAFDKYPITWFGQDIAMGGKTLVLDDGTTYFYLDSAYVYMLFEYGIVIFVVIMLAYIYGCKKATKFNDSYLCIWFAILAIDSIVGNQLLSIWAVPILFVPFCRVDYLNEGISLLNKEKTGQKDEAAK